MKKITIYSTPLCGFCKMAKQLLTEKGVEFEEVDVSTPEGREKLAEKGDFRTVPQIYIGEDHIGGYDELSALDKEGKLDVLIS